MEVSMPAFMVGYKDVQGEEYNPKVAIKKHIAIEILLNMIIGKTSNLYKELYEKGIIFFKPPIFLISCSSFNTCIITPEHKNNNALY